MKHVTYEKTPIQTFFETGNDQRNEMFCFSMKRSNVFTSSLFSEQK